MAQMKVPRSTHLPLPEGHVDDEELKDGHVGREPGLSKDAVQAAERDSHPSQQQRRQPEQPAVPRPRAEGQAPERLLAIAIAIAIAMLCSEE